MCAFNAYKLPCKSGQFVEIGNPLDRVAEDEDEANGQRDLSQGDLIALGVRVLCGASLLDNLYQDIKAGMRLLDVTKREKASW